MLKYNSLLKWIFKDNLFFSFLKIRATDHTYEDCRLMLKARELKLPFESGLVEFEKIMSTNNT